MTLTIGEVAPDFSLLDTQGRKWSVASYDGAPATVRRVHVQPLPVRARLAGPDR